jgi:glutathione S-transferase
MSYTLYGINYSPWTERARWALHHHGIDYRYREYVPFLGEPVIRWLYRGVDGKPSVPLLKGPGVGIGDSWEILEWAATHGAGASLRCAEEEVFAWYDKLDRMIDLLRVRVTRDTLGDAAALTEAASAVTPRFAARAFKPVAARGARHIANKYGFESAGDPDESRRDIERVLQDVSDSLAGDYLVGDSFSAADLIAATAIHGIEPLAGYPTLGPETRRMWSDAMLATRFPELLTWRDEMYARHWPGGRTTA